MYDPKPMDTGGVALPEELLALTEQIAENVHDVWAAGRIAEGWTYGQTRDTEKKTTPLLVPYGELPEPTRVGNWRFEGWFETAEGGEHITAESNVRKAYDHTVTAHWTDTTPMPVKVTFDLNGGWSQNFYDKELLPEAAVGTLPEPYRPSYNFLGWFTEAEGGEQVTEETIVTAAVTYYAHWKSRAEYLYKVTFDAQGGVASATEIERGFGELLGVVPTLHRVRALGGRLRPVLRDDRCRRHRVDVQGSRRRHGGHTLQPRQSGHSSGYEGPRGDSGEDQRHESHWDRR